MTEARVKTWFEDSVAHVRLARPEKRNGLDLAMFQAIAEAGSALRDDRSVRAVVLAGEGPAFCAGLDFKAFMASPGVKDQLLERPEGALANLAQQVGWIWRELPVPVIAALHGAVLGGGLQIALGADVRIAAPNTRLSVMEIEWGLIPDMSISQTLLPLVRPDVAAELTYSGRIVEADEAATLGLVTRVCEAPLEEATHLAQLIAGKSPHAVRAAKRLLTAAPSLDPGAALRLETELQRELLGSKNQVEAVKARLQQRAPSFEDP